MPTDARVLELLSYYRDAELRGAGLLLRLIAMMPDDPDAQVKLTRHVAEETHHAWLWTKRITELGGVPVAIGSGYHARLGMRIVPRSVLDLLALTIVVETRSLTRYQEHAARPHVDEATRDVLRAVSSDERWHIDWMRQKLEQMTRDDAPAQERARAVTERYRQIDEEVYAELYALERDRFAAPEIRPPERSSE